MAQGEGYDVGASLFRIELVLGYTLNARRSPKIVLVMI